MTHLWFWASRSDSILVLASIFHNNNTQRLNTTILLVYIRTHGIKGSFFCELEMFASIRIFRLLLLLSFVASFGNSNIIQVNKECYSVGEDISITFEITDAQPRDFIGIYLPGDSMATLPDPSGIHWLWTCGSRSCTSTDGITRATVTYKDNLEVGMWKAVLVHNNGPPYVGIVESKSFLVSSACSGVTATPTINRASEPTIPSDRKSVV